MYKYIEHTRTYMHKHIHTYRSHKNYPPTHRQLNIEITCDNRKTRMYACVNSHIDEYIRACVRAHRYTCHQYRHALIRRYETLCIRVYIIKAQKDTYTCTIKASGRTHVSIAHTSSKSHANSSSHVYV